MNKLLFRRLRWALRKAVPKYSAKLIRVLGKMVDGARNKQQLEGELRRFIAYSIRGLRQRGLPEDYIVRQAQIIGLAGVVCLDLCEALWRVWSESARQSRENIKATLQVDLIPQWATLVFALIKYNLWDRYWLPIRHQSNSVSFRLF